MRIETNNLMVALYGKRETAKRNRNRRKFQTALSIKEESPLLITDGPIPNPTPYSFPFLINPK